METKILGRPRRPRRFPVLGHAVGFARDPLGFLEAMRSAGDVARVSLGTQEVYLVNSAALVRRILTDATTFERGLQAERLRVFLGDGLVTSDGPPHLRNRRLVQPAFHHQRIGGYADIMREETEAMTRRWQDGQQVAVNTEVMRVALRVVGRTLFSTALGAEVVDEVVRSVPLILDGVGRRARDPFGLVARLPTAGNREFNASIVRLRAVVSRMVKAYREAGADHGDIVSMLLLARDADTHEALTDSQVSDEVITMLAAGTDTTANTVAWALHVLGGRPELARSLQAEVDSVVGDRAITMADMPKLDLTRRIISETLRMYPQAWMLTRMTTQPISLGGVELRAGTTLLLPICGLHRDPEVYPRPGIFDPGRWSGAVAGPVKPSFLPFGAGRHQCIGEAFAWTEATIMLAVIAQHWRLLPVPGRPVNVNALTTLKPTQLPMIPHRRTATAAR